MCKKGETVSVNPKQLPGIKYRDMTTPVKLDRCIAELVLYLNKNGVRTYGSCCGHGKEEAWIQVRKRGRYWPVGKVWELMSAWMHSRGQFGRWYIKIIENGVMTIRFGEVKRC